jgi:hypothetical protein
LIETTLNPAMPSLPCKLPKTVSKHRENRNRDVMTNLPSLQQISLARPAPCLPGLVPSQSKNTDTIQRFSPPASPAIRKSHREALTMQESDGKMLFFPTHVEVRKDEQIKFMIYKAEN